MSNELSGEIDKESAIQNFLMALLKRRLVTGEDQRKGEGFLSRLRTSEGVEVLRSILLELTQKMATEITEADMDAMADSYIEDALMFRDPFFVSHPNLNQQRFLALKLWKELILADVWKDYFELINHAYLMLVVRLEERSRQGLAGKYEIRLHSELLAMVELDEAQIQQRITNMLNYPLYPPDSIDESNLFNKLCGDITYEVLGLLLRFDYGEVLRGKGNKDPDLN